ncbi:hypothetical protein M885DRAFT_528338 [Pelagophyceae sp. CCMP2097]|nr:hypothetical protein M885DRAFT_528338 [Pelagophyceae sp. CCMP2097]
MDVVDLTGFEPASRRKRQSVIDLLDDDEGPKYAPPQADVRRAAALVQRIGGEDFKERPGRARRQCRKAMVAAPRESVEEIARIVVAAAGGPKALDAGDLIECGCCFDDECPLADVVQCSEGHVFCTSCLKRYAAEAVFGGGQGCVGLACISSGGADKCPGTFFDSALQKALPTKEYDQLHETAAVAAVRKAALDVFACPACGVAAEFDANRMGFECPQQGCPHKCCRGCADGPHAGKCEAKSETAKRRKVEEAMTAARVRSCPRCKAHFYKSEGCNKMTCSCGAIVCYVCCAVIDHAVGYAHFCQEPHCDHSKCNKCILFSKADEDHEAMRRAALAQGGAARVDALLEARPVAPAAAPQHFVDYAAVMANAHRALALAQLRFAEIQQRRNAAGRPAADVQLLLQQAAARRLRQAPPLPAGLQEMLQAGRRRQPAAPFQQMLQQAALPAAARQRRRGAQPRRDERRQDQ